MTVLATTDFSDPSADALRYAAFEARRRQTDLLVVHAIDTASERWSYLQETDEFDHQGIEKRAVERLESFVRDAVDQTERPPADFEILNDRAADAIVERGNDVAELIVMGATGAGRIESALLGSTAEEVARNSNKPVLVVPEGAEPAPASSILAPVDTSECSRQSLNYAIDRATLDDSTLSIMHATVLPAGAMMMMDAGPSPAQTEAHREQVKSMFGKFLEDFDFDDLEVNHLLRFGAPHREILNAADEQDSDLIIMGTHGRRGFERFFLGSTATRVLRNIPCPVITLRHRED
jgi:nucleotide-binding universal stress UspA family protein